MINGSPDSTDDESNTDCETVKKTVINPEDSENKHIRKNKWEPPTDKRLTVTEKPPLWENLSRWQKLKIYYFAYSEKCQILLNDYKLSAILLLVVFIVVLCWYCIPWNEEKCHVILNDLKTTFPNQDEEFWTTITSSVNFTAVYNEPSTLIYLYTDETKDTVRQILKAVTKYTQNILEAADCNAIDVHSSQLNTIGRSDYGQILDKYRPQLEKKRIMTVHDFDQLRGSVAQVFHWFCDQYTPVIPKAVFQFTIKVDQIVAKHRLIPLVDQILVDRWIEELNNDSLYPLIARVTGMVLFVNKELS